MRCAQCATVPCRRLCGRSWRACLSQLQCSFYACVCYRIVEMVENRLRVGSIYPKVVLIFYTYLIRVRCYHQVGCIPLLFECIIHMFSSVSEQLCFFISACIVLSGKCDSFCVIFNACAVVSCAKACGNCKNIYFSNVFDGFTQSCSVSTCAIVFTCEPVTIPKIHIFPMFFNKFALNVKLMLRQHV